MEAPGTVEPTPVPGSGRVCKQCKKRWPRSGFSGRQWSQRGGRRCRNCVTANSTTTTTTTTTTASNTGTKASASSPMSSPPKGYMENPYGSLVLSACACIPPPPTVTAHTFTTRSPGDDSGNDGGWGGGVTAMPALRSMVAASVHPCPVRLLTVESLWELFACPSRVLRMPLDLSRLSSEPRLGHMDGCRGARAAALLHVGGLWPQGEEEGRERVWHECVRQAWDALDAPWPKLTPAWWMWAQPLLKSRVSDQSSLLDVWVTLVAAAAVMWKHCVVEQPQQPPMDAPPMVTRSSLCRLIGAMMPSQARASALTKAEQALRAMAASAGGVTLAPDDTPCAWEHGFRYMAMITLD